MPGIIKRRRKTLGKVYTMYEKDKAFGKLRQYAKGLVRGAGTVMPHVAFVGEAPGQYEDERGEPFVGPSGKLLNDLLAHIGLDREDAFLTNCVWYRPSKNRDPSESELEASLPYLYSQLFVVQPRIIVALGKFAHEATGGKGPITFNHGKVRKWEGVCIMSMYHPAYVLRNAKESPTMYEDIEKVGGLL